MGGIAGGISLALTLPASPGRTGLLVVAYAGVVFTIAVHLTLPRLLGAVSGAARSD